MVSKVFEKLVNNRIVDHLEKRGPSSDFQHGFRFSRSSADLLTVASDTIARAFNRPVATRAATKYLALFRLFSVIEGFECFWIGSLHKNIQLMLEFPKAPLLVQHFPTVR